MRHLIILILAVLCLNLSATAQQAILDTKVSLQYKEVSLEKAIRDLQKKYKINFSYVNNLIPLKTKVSIDIKEQTLKTALDELFKNVEVNYYIIGDQVVLKNEPKKTSAVIERIEARKPQYISTITGLERGADVQTIESDSNEIVVNTSDIRPDSPQPMELTFSDQLVASLVQMKDQVKDEVKTMNTKPVKLSHPKNLFKKDKEITAPDENKDFTHVDTIIEKNKPAEAADSNDVVEIDSIPAKPSAYIKRPVQLSFASPLGTNGLESGKVVNTVSLNILTGYAAGLEGAEFAGLLNIEKDYVKGAQFAGFGNLVKNNVTGAQFAGFMNLNGDTLTGGQFAGFLNLAKSANQAAQFAGFANIVGSYVKGAQFAGFTNISKGITGPQAAGFANVSGSVKGAQVAGFTNIANGDLTGSQISGFLNFAHKVKGVQIGFINVADSIEGAQIGFLCFSRKGYRRLEVWGGEALYANVAFKMGNRNFYNIFAVGGQTSGDTFRWGWGYGVGSEIGLGKALSMNIDAIAYHINEDQIWTDELNLLNTLRATLGVKLAGHTYLFAGPTFNVMVSNYSSGDSSDYGSGIAPSWTTYNETHGRTNVKMWPGINAGIRF